jgi:hypothetical protein
MGSPLTGCACPRHLQSGLTLRWRGDTAFASRSCRCYAGRFWSVGTRTSRGETSLTRKRTCGHMQNTSPSARKQPNTASRHAGPSALAWGVPGALRSCRFSSRKIQIPKFMKIVDVPYVDQSKQRGNATDRKLRVFTGRSACHPCRGYQNSIFLLSDVLASG